MIKAEYKGISEGLLRGGKVYPITTQCKGNKLIVRANGAELCYPNLECFMKFWKVRAVYHG